MPYYCATAATLFVTLYLYYLQLVKSGHTRSLVNTPFPRAWERTSNRASFSTGISTAQLLKSDSRTNCRRRLRRSPEAVHRLLRGRACGSPLGARAQASNPANDRAAMGAGGLAGGWRRHSCDGMV